MIWGALSGVGRGPLHFLPPGTMVNGTRYLQILREKLPTFMEIQRCTHFLQDGAPCHTSRAVKEWFRTEDIQLISPWPGNSPDLNVIENAWTKLKAKVSEYNPASIPSLIAAIKTVWCTEISNEYCIQLAHSMPERIRLRLKIRGKHVKY